MKSETSDSVNLEAGTHIHVCTIVTCLASSSSILSSVPTFPGNKCPPWKLE